MGCRELIESLRKTADSKITGIWDDANQEAERIRAEYAAAIEKIRLDAERQAAVKRERILADAAADAVARFRLQRLESERRFADRLFEIARQRLPLMARAGPDRMFASLARELPELSWGTIAVNPRDAAEARSIFPNAETIPDPAIAGGLAATTNDGRITIVNTLERRLERAWEELLPELMKEATSGIARATPSSGIPG